ncbi:hypothetical protein LI171_15065 [Emergencia timonensis]|jgi:hypothetical protein|nr:hypothetical protein [Emergencia timonensis]MCB6477568.1 hypothetical protein [Emergencia timonensis]
MPISKEDIINLKISLEEELKCETIQADRKKEIERELKSIREILNSNHRI